MKIKYMLKDTVSEKLLRLLMKYDAAWFICYCYSPDLIKEVN